MQSIIFGMCPRSISFQGLFLKSSPNTKLDTDFSSTPPPFLLDSKVKILLPPTDRILEVKYNT